MSAIFYEYLITFVNDRLWIIIIDSTIQFSDTLFAGDIASGPNNDLIQIYSDSLKGYIIHNSYIKFAIDEKNKTLNIKQIENNGWILFKNLNLDSWIINFEGKENIEQNTDLMIDQRLSEGENIKFFGKIFSDKKKLLKEI